MPTTKNDITGDPIRSKPNSDLFRKNWDLIFGSPDENYSPEENDQPEKAQNVTTS